MGGYGLIYGWPEPGGSRARITHRINIYTGERIPVEGWVRDIDPEDMDWFERQWDAEDEFDYKLWIAGIRSE